MNIVEKSQEYLKGKGYRVVFTECEDERILGAARILKDKEICQPVLYGHPDLIHEAAEKYDVSLDGIEIFNCEDEETLKKYATLYHELVPMYSEKVLLKKMKRELSGAAILTKLGVVDLLASGVVNSTGDVVLTAQQFIGLQDDISVFSSIGFQWVPKFDGSNENMIIGVADCAVNQRPSAEELAEIAITSADTYSKVMQEPARVAMLSSSTLGSASGDSIELVTDALKIAHERRSDLIIEGEYQIDTALVPEIAARKVKVETEVAGRANVLIFPNLDAGNIAVKCMQMFAKLGSHGPIMQGFSKPVTDFSRAAKMQDVVGNVTLCLMLVE